MIEDKELLAVLDLPKDEQRDWCIEKKLLNLIPYTECARYETLADLALRLWGEARKTKEKWWAYWDGCKKVIDYRIKRDWEVEAMINGSPLTDYFEIWTFCAAPIDKIIAALLAKQEKK